MSKPVIGFIGVGLMGHGMAKNILEGGYALHIKGNRNREPIDDLVARGAQEVASPKEMAAACDIIHICLSNSPQVESVFHGDDGILAGMREGLIVIDATTADPVSTMKLAAALNAKGGAMVDAPLGRTPKEAEAGELDVMVGCDDAQWDTVRPLIECWGGNINRIGPVGSGHKMKLIMNFISMGYAALYSEATVLAAKVGVSPQNVQQVIGTSRMGNGFFDTFMKYTVGRDRDAHKFAIANASKDVRYVNNMANDAGVMNVMASAVKHYFTHIEAIGHGDDYVPMMSDHIARLNGMDMAEEVEKGK
ncbi:MULTISPECIES: NAD(P)-dependent oxidoreductase [unclassified Marinovum]